MKKIILFITVMLMLSVPCLSAPISFTDGVWETTFGCAEQYNTTIEGFPFDWDCDDIEMGVNKASVKFDLSDGVTNNWTQSTAYPNQYYYSGTQLVGQNDRPSQVTLDNFTCWGSASYPRSSPLAEFDFSYEDVDSLGSDHLYVYSLVDPDTQVAGYIAGWFSHDYYESGDNQGSIQPAANNPLGTGNGTRFVKGDGKNGPGVGSMKVTFPSAQKELWIRWYSKYELGFEWRSISQDKMIYIHTGGTSHFIGYYGFNLFSITSQEGGSEYTFEGRAAPGWDQVMASGGDGASGKKSDGGYHCYEIHLKMDTGETLGVPNMDGVAEFWIDGELGISNKNAYLSYQLSIDGSNPDSVLGWLWFEFDANQDFPENGDFKNMDWDDITIYNKQPPKRDVHGNYFIGPIDWPGGATAVLKRSTLKRAIIK